MCKICGCNIKDLLIITHKTQSRKQIFNDAMKQLEIYNQRCDQGTQK